MLAVGYYRHDALNQGWVNVNIQPGAKHDTVAQYWANVVSAS